MRKKTISLVLFVALAAGAAMAKDPPTAGAPVKLPGLKSAARITRDVNGVLHVRASHDVDLFFLQGWVHARDRLFQMDHNRRVASGTLAELLGPGALPTDVTLRTIGLRRAAERSLAALSPETREALRAYARGVNAWASGHPLPPEYGALEITRFEPWTPVDSVVAAKLIAFSLSFDLDVDPTVALMSYVKAGQALGFDGAKLFFQDLDRSAPFDPAATVPDASGLAPLRAAPVAGNAIAPTAASIRPETEALARAYLEKVRALPIFEGILDRDKRAASNLWAIGPEKSASGRPLVANDPHLALGVPSTFYPMGLDGGDYEVFGSGFPGIPGIVQGYNRHISWGTTNNAVDVTDTYQEQLVPDATSPSGFSTLYKGELEWVIPIPETFRANRPGNGVPEDVAVVPPGGGIPPATLIVPRRNNGPIVQFDPATGAAISVQYTGFSPTRELDTFLGINRARNLDEFVEALQFFDFGSQNFVYGDDLGNIAYFTSGEIPVREDLQAMTVAGLPPAFIRDGRGGNEWLPVAHPQPHQAVAFEVLPFSEMPQIVNPPRGWFVNANNDPAGVTLDNDPLNQLRPGGGLYYMAYAWDRGFRAGRIEELCAAKLAGGDGKISFDEMQEIQADVTMRDAQFFAPWIAGAFARAAAPGADPMLAALAADPRVAEAAARLGAWSGNAPTGIPEGWDASDTADSRAVPDAAEVDASVAATIYSAWRSRVVVNTIDAILTPLGLPLPGSEESLSALRHLLANFEANHGKGASGVDFFAVPGVTDPAVRRDVAILKSLAQALDLLTSPEFAPAFGGSTDLADYRWGKLHRIVFKHPLGGPFNVPPAGGAFPAPLPGLAGIPTDGGFQTIDASSHGVRAATLDGFMFGAGPVRRFVSEPAPGAPRSESVWPGGTSGVLGSPFYIQFLPHWLANDALPLWLGEEEVRPHAADVEKLVPAPNVENGRKETAGPGGRTR